jgi:hypothetical protein
LSKKRKVQKIEPQLLPPELLLPETEVSIGGEQFNVTVKSRAPLGDVVSHCLDLYTACSPEAPRRSGMGFAGPGAGCADISIQSGPDLLALDAG